MHHKVAVYGTLLRGYGNHMAHLTEAKFLGEVTFHGCMYSLGAFPAVSTHGNNLIKGELYEVDDDTLEALDRLEGHPRFYERQIIDTSGGPAWVYIINHNDLSMHDVVSSGNWREWSHRPRNLSNYD